MVLNEALIASSASRYRSYAIEQEKRKLQKDRRAYLSASEVQRRREHIAAATGNPQYAT